LKVSDLAANLKNPRTISDKKLAMLKKALEKFGDLSGIVFNRKSKQLVGGHQRRKLFGDKTPVTITKKYLKPTKTGTVAEGFVELNGERFSYREVSWDRPIELAANIAANNGAGEWDIPQLGEWLKELGHFDLNFDLDLTMFDDKERAAFLPETIEAVEGEDNVPATPKIPKARLGDLYELGEHRLLCGDATSIDAVERLMNGEKADITFTSPPYNAAKNGHLTGNVSGFDLKYKNSSDAMSDDDYFDLLCGFTSIALLKTRYVFCNLQMLSHNRNPLFRYQSQFQNQIKDILIWNKKQCPPNIVKGAFNTRWEYIFCFSEDTKTRGFPCEWRGQYPNVVDTESNSGNDFAEEHKAGFPVAFPSWFLEKFDFAKSVYEPFCGTGTTMIAAEKYKRRCFGMELDPHYCDVIVERWETFTGKKAKLMNSLKAPIRKPVKQGAKQVHGNA